MFLGIIQLYEEIEKIIGFDEEGKVLYVQLWWIHIKHTTTKK
jgi:hypothetical protein